uniref:Uncharacterized protein n=1 Tax=Lepeophtheirus salmonis TaxID=72036 RepID=A0A0K2SVE4_LEPSM
MGSTMCYEDIIQEKNVRIKELEIENMELKSKLDKFQSILISGSQSQSDVGRVRRVQRGLGISAEPQCLQSITDITNTSFPQVKKSDRFPSLRNLSSLRNGNFKKLLPKQLRLLGYLVNMKPSFKLSKLLFIRTVSLISNVPPQIVKKIF